MKCKLVKGKTANEPFAALPKSRKGMTNPFRFVAVDFFDILYVCVNSTQKKAFVMLFACATLHGVCLELVSDLIAYSCISFGI